MQRDLPLGSSPLAERQLFEAKFFPVSRPRNDPRTGNALRDPKMNTSNPKRQRRGQAWTATSYRTSSLALFEVALLGFITLPAGGSAAVAAGEGPLRALRPDSPGGRVTNERIHSSRVLPSEIHKPEAKSATSKSVSEGACLTVVTYSLAYASG